MATRVFRMTDGKPDPEGISEAGRIVREGGIVAFPTETVYGLAANPDLPEAMRRLVAMKERPAESPFTLHLARREDLDALVPRVPLRARRLLERYWPGPLTIVCEDGRGGTIGARVPANAIAQALIAAAGVRVVAPSANLRGAPPACDASEVLASLEGRIDAVVDGGRSNLRQASTVVRFRGGAYEILREGILAEPDIRALAAVSILFVCTGNSCRSPMAEGLLRHALAGRSGLASDALERQGLRIRSAGVSAQPGTPATPEAVAVLAELGADIRDHNAALLTEKAVRDATDIYAMAPRHLDAVLELDASAKGKARLLDPEGRSILDPIGGSFVEYRLCANHIQRCVRILADAL